MNFLEELGSVLFFSKGTESRSWYKLVTASPAQMVTVFSLSCGGSDRSHLDFLKGPDSGSGRCQ